MPMFYDADGNEIGEFDNPGDMRVQLEAANKALKDAEKARLKAEAELAPIRAAEKERAVTEALSSLPAQAAKVWLRVQPDAELTPEAVAAFAEEFGFEAAPPSDPATARTTSYPDASGNNVPGSYSPIPGAATFGGKKLDWDEFLAQLRSPATHQQAMRAFADGRVDTPYLDARGHPLFGAQRQNAVPTS